MPRARKKGQFKLRFHHQALPQEYLDHYEATQNSLQQKQIAAAKLQSSKSAKAAADIIAKQEQQNNESVRNWLQKISEYQHDKKSRSSTALVQDDRAASTSNQPTANSDTPKQTRLVSYSDLPYMGEMTLENSKPRRGRKPKKADICHLIYKNYGTILPGTPKSATEGHQKPTSTAETTVETRKSDLQNKIINSLLEKRLTQEDSLLSVSPSVVATSPSNVQDDVPKVRKEEPLNLCMRDASDTMTVSSGDDDTESIVESGRSTPLILQSDISSDATLAANLKMALPNFHSALLEKRPSSSEPPLAVDASDNGSANGYMYWPGAGVFLHPMALYYQNMLDASRSGLANKNITLSSTRAKQCGIESPPTSSPSPITKNETSGQILVPKNISQLLKQKKASPTRITEKSFPVPRTPSETSSSSKSTAQSSLKRKRSAIFIPPLPSNESSNNHATEVSICKFKFTGGAKPSLQEKKMLSVDAGGNFRYYSGTGDKSIRGYEFFPRESLHQASLTSASSAGAFLNTPGKRIPIDLPPPSQGLSNELLQIPELASPAAVGVMPSIVGSHPPTIMHPRSNHSSDRRKRKSRRSLQREKLEKTFKEKGFLIQTQQLESAEGATYCKFRQLRKFTRYLFRSWKDYLPGELQQGNQINPALQHVAGVSLADLESQLNSSATATSSPADIQNLDN